MKTKKPKKRMGAAEASKVVKQDDPLKILGFDSMPSKAELDSRYRQLAMKHHPDHGGTASQFKLIHAAWSLLS